MTSNEVLRCHCDIDYEIQSCQAIDIITFSKMRTVKTKPGEEWLLIIRYNPLTNTTALYLITFQKHFKEEVESTLHYLHFIY